MVPTPSESIAALQQLLRIWLARDGEASIPLLDGTSLPGMAIHVQVEHIAELTESVIELIRHNIYLTTAPLMRLSLECAVNALWWASKPTGVRSSMHEATRQSGLLAKAMRKIAPRVVNDTKGLDEALRVSAEFASDEARYFEKRCKAINGGEWIYPYYRLLSEASHGGPRSGVSIKPRALQLITSAFDSCSGERKRYFAAPVVMLAQACWFRCSPWLESTATARGAAG